DATRGGTLRAGQPPHGGALLSRRAAARGVQDIGRNGRLARSGGGDRGVPQSRTDAQGGTSIMTPMTQPSFYVFYRDDRGRRRRVRVWADSDRGYRADFRAFADVGGEREALVPSGESCAPGE